MSALQISGPPVVGENSKLCRVCFITIGGKPAPGVPYWTVEDPLPLDEWMRENAQTITEALRIYEHLGVEAAARMLTQ